MRMLSAAILVFTGLCLSLPAAGAEADPSVKSVQFTEKKVMVTRDGGMAQATNTVELPQSIQVKTNGIFIVKGGKERRLREGQVLDAEGMLTSPDGTVMPVTDHVVMKKGRLLLVKDGDSSPATGELVLGDGRRVKPDGTVTTRDGRIQRMLDGQTYTFGGQTIPTTDTATLLKGAVVLQKDGGRITLRRDQKMAMSDGTQVLGNGTVIFPNGSKHELVEGVILKLPGVEKVNR